MASPASNASRTPEASGSTGSGPDTRAGVDVTAVTSRDDFLLELGECLSGQAAVRPVESISAALESLTSSKRPQVLVIDARDLSDVRGDVELAHSQAEHAVVLVFATADSERQVGVALKGSNVFAVLPIPFDKRKTSAVLEGAVADAVSRKADPPAPRRASVSQSSGSASGATRPGGSAMGVTIEPYRPQSEPATPAAGGGSAASRAGLFIGIAVAVVAIAAGAYFFTRKSGEPETAPAAQPNSTVQESSQAPAPQDAAPSVETALVTGKVDELLERARLAMRERRYSEPTGDNALLYYRSAVAADPSNGEATDGLQRVATALAARCEEAIGAGRFDEASLALANLKSAEANDGRIPALELRLMTAQMGKALADGNLDRATALIRQAQSSPAISADQISKWRAEIARRQDDAKVQRFATLISDRIRDGRLVDPAEDSAKTYLEQLHDAAPTHPTTARMSRELNAAYLHKAREAAAANRPADIDRWLNEAKAGGLSASELAAFQRELSIARQKTLSVESDRWAQLARDRIRDGRLTDPAQDSAAYYLTQLQQTDSSNANLAPLSHDLAARLVDRARASAQSSKAGSSVDSDLTQAKRWGADPRDILAVQQMQSAASSSTARGNAPAGASVASLASSLKRTRYVAPEYPSKALSQQLGGAVTVEYTVDTRGDTQDIRVVESTPPGVFDRAAVSAVKRWHYDPTVVNGAPVTVPVRTTIRFELPK